MPRLSDEELVKLFRQFVLESFKISNLRLDVSEHEISNLTYPSPMHLIVYLWECKPRIRFTAYPQAKYILFFGGRIGFDAKISLLQTNYSIIREFVFDKNPSFPQIETPDIPSFTHNSQPGDEEPTMTFLQQLSTLKRQLEDILDTIEQLT